MTEVEQGSEFSSCKLGLWFTLCFSSNHFKFKKIPQVLKQELGEKKHLWNQKLNLLEKYKEALERDFIRMAGNLRRAKTEEFHLRKELSARYPWLSWVLFVGAFCLFLFALDLLWCGTKLN